MTSTAAVEALRRARLTSAERYLYHEWCQGKLKLPPMARKDWQSEAGCVSFSEKQLKDHLDQAEVLRQLYNQHTLTAQDAHTWTTRHPEAALWVKAITKVNKAAQRIRSVRRPRAALSLVETEIYLAWSAGTFVPRAVDWHSRVSTGRKEVRSTKKGRRRARLLNEVYQRDDLDIRHVQAWPRLDHDAFLLLTALKKVKKGAPLARTDRTTENQSRGSESRGLVYKVPEDSSTDDE